MRKFKFDEITAHLKQSGFILSGSEIYGGTRKHLGFLDLLGINLKDNIKELLVEKEFIQKDPRNVGMQSAILPMNPAVWQASGT